MAFIPAPDTIEVVLRFIWAGQVVAITLSFYKSGGADTTQMGTLLTTLRDWWDTEMTPLLSDKLSLVNLKATNLSSDIAPVVELPVSPPIAGDITGASVANNVAIVTTFLTDLRGRSFRGRVYTPGLAVGALTDSVTVASAQALALSEAYVAMSDAAFAIDFVHSVVSRYTAGLPRATAEVTPITAYRTEQYLDSQRRRLAGRGE